MIVVGHLSMRLWKRLLPVFSISCGLFASNVTPEKSLEADAPIVQKGAGTEALRFFEVFNDISEMNDKIRRDGRPGTEREGFSHTQCL